MDMKTYSERTLDAPTDAERLEAPPESVYGAPTVSDRGARGLRIAKAAASASCLILCAVGILVHTAAAAELFSYLKNGWQNRIVSLIFPDVVIEEKADDPDPVVLDGDEEASEDGNGDTDSIPPSLKVMNEDLSARAAGGLAISNETEYETNIEALMSSVPAASSPTGAEQSDAPLVLIYHTHGTEAYADCAGNSFRSRDTEKNTVAVGKTLAETLEKCGVGTIHIEEMFDEKSWSGAYDSSTLAVRDVLSRYPSVKYVFDVHRDCIGNDDAGYVRSVTDIGGDEAAQLMIVCGTDSGGSAHKNWRENLSFALSLQSRLWNADNTLMRPIDLRCASFYQDTSPGALLIEFGTCANTLTEAKRSAVMFGCVLSGYITGEDLGGQYADIAEEYGLH